MLKRILSLLLAAVITAVAAVTVGAAKTKLPFTDVTESKWFFDAVCEAYENGIMLGTSEKTFDPNGTMTRAQIVTLLSRLAGERV
ncbi:MAG: S-layer homology domain-containing protein, partial [Clostridia bacterium]|nr:S-layer homology domain-containing protein [Clostridia bacterium]